VLQKAQKFMMALVAVGAIAVGSAVIANAASSGEATTGNATVADSGTTGQQGDAGRGPRAGEEPLTGDTADKVRAAALEEVPGGTIIRLETDAGDAAYEAHVRKSDGTEVVVLVNQDFAVTDVQEAGPGGRGGRPCDRDGDGNPGGDSGAGSGQNEGTGFGDSGSASQI
jgi:uncharacterized membrane protein YkoI